jgi:hypothetical protein
VSRMGKTKGAYRNLVGNRSERGHFEKLGIEKIILKSIFKK